MVNGRKSVFKQCFCININDFAKRFEFVLIQRFHIAHNTNNNRFGLHRLVIELQNIIESYILNREQLVNLFVLIDCRHEPQQIDLEFMEWLGENGIPFSIIFTKLDKLSTTKGKDNLSAYQQKLLETWEELPPIFVTSSEKNKGREEVLDYIENINKTL